MKNRTWRRSVLPFVFVLAALLLSACAGGGGRAAALTGSSWPGFTQDGDVAYLAYQNAVYAIDLTGCQDGDCETVWQYSAASTRRSLLGGRPPVQFFAEPAVDDGIVVVGDYSETLHAIDAETGEPAWTFSTDRERFIGAATVSDGMVFVGAADGVLYALDAGDGGVVWTFEAESEIWDAPLLADEVLYVPSLDHRLYAIDAGTGRALWSFEAGGAVVSAPTLDDGVLYFGAFDRIVYAVSAESGTLLWSHEVSDWVWDSPAVVDGTLILGDLSGAVYALRTDDGSEAWQFQAEGAVVGTPLVEDGIAYFGSGTATGTPLGRIYAVDADNGLERWQTTIESEFSSRILFFDTGTRIREVPIFAPIRQRDESLIVALQQGDNLLMSVNAEGGAAGWLLPAQGDAVASASSETSADGEEEKLTTRDFLVRWLPLYALMTILMLMLMRRRQAK